MNRNIAYCCIDCSSCPLFIATKGKNLELKKDVAEKWGALFNKTFDINDMVCNGCKSGHRFFLSLQCDIAECNIKRNNSSCKECEEYMCERISRFYEWQKKHETNVLP